MTQDDYRRWHTDKRRQMADEAKVAEAFAATIRMLCNTVEYYQRGVAA